MTHAVWKREHVLDFTAKCGPSVYLVIHKMGMKSDHTPWEESIIKIIFFLSALGSMQMPCERDLLLSLKSKPVHCWLPEQSLLTEYHRLTEMWPNWVQGRLQQLKCFSDSLQSRCSLNTLSTPVVLLMRRNRSDSSMLTYNTLLRSQHSCRKSPCPPSM